MTYSCPKLTKRELREIRQQKVHNLAHSYEGFGWNLNSGFLLLQAASGMFGMYPKESFQKTFKVLMKPQAISQGLTQCINAVKDVRDTGTQGTQTTLNHALEELKRLQDESKGDDQRSTQAITDFMNQIKQMHHMMHEASSQMSRSH